jgi:hypothetical protein
MNVFKILFALTAVILIATGIIAIAAPILLTDIVVPVMQDFPDWGTDLDWTVTVTNWTGIGNFFVLVGAVLVYIFEFFGYMLGMVALTFQLLGFIPAIATAVAALLFIAFIGSVLMFIRGSETGTK